MVIIGAGNLGKHIADQLIDEKYNEEIIFYDDHANPATPIFNRFKIINTENLLEDYFKNKNASFIAAAGHPRIRARLVAKAESLGGKSKVSFLFMHISQIFHLPAQEQFFNQGVVFLIIQKSVYLQSFMPIRLSDTMW